MSESTRGGKVQQCSPPAQAAYQSLKYPSKETAWPHTRNQHNLQMGAGRIPGSEEGDLVGYQAMANGPFEIKAKHTKADYFPNFLEGFVDPKEVSVSIRREE